MKKIIIIVFAVLLLTGIGLFVGMKFLGGGDAESTAEAEGAAEEKKEEADLTVYTLEPFVVNLSGSGGRRYLKMKMTVEMDGTKLEKLTTQTYKIRDALIILLSSKTLEDISGAEGKYSLREEIKVRLDRIIGKDIIKNVYLLEFVVQ